MIKIRNMNVEKLQNKILFIVNVQLIVQAVKYSKKEQSFPKLIRPLFRSCKQQNASFSRVW